VAASEHGDSDGYAPRGSACVYGFVGNSFCSLVATGEVALLAAKEAG
jgi:hypothetical protein